ncbi:hypothetical protein Ancab_007687 [Ancistrocladus abbreviatus]
MPGLMPQNTSAGQSKQSNLVKATIIALLALIVVVGLVILIIWLTINPKNLMYSIDKGSIEGYNLSNDHFNSTFKFVINAYNPYSRFVVYYDKMGVAVSYGGQTVAYQELHPFFQPHKNITWLSVNPTARYVALSKETSRHLTLDRTAGQIKLDVHMKARIRLKVGVWKSRHYKLKVLCPPVTINFSSPDKFTVTNCDVHF